MSYFQSPIGSVLLAACLAWAVPATANPPLSPSADCPHSAWDLSREVELFRDAATPIAAGSDASHAPRLEPNHLYALSLRPIGLVTLALPRDPSSRQRDTHAGLLFVDAAVAGQYRVSVDGPFWIDVIGPAGSVQPIGYEGHQVCTLIHKSVQFALPAGRVVMQVSGGAAEVKIAITPT